MLLNRHSQTKFSYQMLRVINDMRCAIKSSYPVIAVSKNVTKSFLSYFPNSTYLPYR